MCSCNYFSVFQISAMGVVLLIGCILILLGGGYLFYKKWSREHRLQSLLIGEIEIRFVFYEINLRKHLSALVIFRLFFYDVISKTFYFKYVTAVYTVGYLSDLNVL